MFVDSFIDVISFFRNLYQFTQTVGVGVEGLVEA